MQKSELVKHMLHRCPKRLIKCNDCSLQICHIDLASHRDLCNEDCCSQFRGTCPFCHNKKESLTRQQLIEKHIQVCPARPRACDFVDVGCKILEGKERLREHEQTLQGMAQTS